MNFAVYKKCWFEKLPQRGGNKLTAFSLRRSFSAAFTPFFFSRARSVYHRRNMYSHKTTIPQDVAAGVISRKHKRHFSYSNVTSKTASAPLIFNHCSIVLFTQRTPSRVRLKTFLSRTKMWPSVNVSDIQTPNARIQALSRR